MLNKEEEKYPFYYSDGLLYAVLMVILCIVWFILLAVIETGLYAIAQIPPVWVIPLAFIAGLVGVYWLCRNKMYPLFTREGIAVLLEDRVELKLHKKNRSIPYKNIRRLTYQDRKRNRGLILSAKGHSLYLEEPLPIRAIPAANRELLHEFYGALAAKAALQSKEA